MASSKVVSTNSDLPRDSSSSSNYNYLFLPYPSPSSLLLSNPHPSTLMDDLFKSIKTVDDVWNDIVAGAANDNINNNNNEMTLEDFLTKAAGSAAVVRDEGVEEEDHPCSLLPLPEASSSSVQPFGNGIEESPSPSVSISNNNNRNHNHNHNHNHNRGKRRAVEVLEEPVDKATLQKQRRMIKNRESAARSRERKQAYTSELEYLVHQLEQENARLLNEEVDRRKERYKQLMECIIEVGEMPKPKAKLRRMNSAQSVISWSSTN